MPEFALTPSPFLWRHHLEKPLIIVTDGMDEGLFRGLKEEHSLNVHPDKKVTRDVLKTLLPKAQGLIIRSATTVDKELMDLAPNLKLVIRAGEGTDNIDKAYAKTKGVKVANTPGANANSAAEHAIALMFTLLRKTAWAHRSMQEGKWDKNSFNGIELWKKTVGIVGFGKIGQIVAKRISGFEPKILFFDPVVEKTDIANARKVDLDTLFKESDVITIHAPYIEQTKNLVTQKQFSLMKKNAILVNAARGGIVNETDLLAALQENKISMAGFDVFASEPLPENSPFRNLSNMVLTPHLGASTDEAQERVGEMAVHQIKEFFLRNNLLNEVK